MENDIKTLTPTKNVYPVKPVNRLFTVLDRMIATQIGKTLLSVLSVLVLIIISHRFMRVLRHAVEGEISGETLFILMALKLVSVGIIFLPPALFVSILMVLGRMCRDNEMAALGAGGVSINRIYRGVFSFVIPLAIVAAVLALEVMPFFKTIEVKLLAKEAQTADIRGLTAGKFNEYSHGDIVLYYEEKIAQNKMHNVFVQSRRHGHLDIVVSNQGHVDEQENGLRYVVLEQGSRYRGVPGQADYSVTEFGEYGIRMGNAESKRQSLDIEAKSTQILVRSNIPAEIAEFQWRLSIPIGILLLAYLAVPLAQIAPRGGIYTNLFIAILIYIIYQNMTAIAQAWIEKSIQPGWLGFWWVYGFLLFVGWILVIRNQGARWYFRGLLRS